MLPSAAIDAGLCNGRIRVLTNPPPPPPPLGVTNRAPSVKGANLESCIFDRFKPSSRLFVGSESGERTLGFAAATGASAAAVASSSAAFAAAALRAISPSSSRLFCRRAAFCSVLAAENLSASLLPSSSTLSASRLLSASAHAASTSVALRGGWVDGGDGVFVVSFFISLLTGDKRAPPSFRANDASGRLPKLSAIEPREANEADPGRSGRLPRRVIGRASSSSSLPSASSIAASFVSTSTTTSPSSSSSSFGISIGFAPGYATN